ncbi:unnamed protein product [Mytilus edulis]|uniref:Novel STAND NTPase 3 domain-containing protein n=1 Tax=Mytilus edulis TaxID=6550 RepID=A0A8S3PQ94_MYTED|nr:unnamed protein product [Mytilus edulis]
MCFRIITLHIINSKWRNVSLRNKIYLEYSPQGDLEDNKTNWLVVGICLHSILSPALRKYVDPVVTNLYNLLKISDQIDLQSNTNYLRTYGAASMYLNYEAINNNKTTHGYRTVLWDYNVQNAVDLSKLFLQTHMAHYTAFDGSCDSSALLGLIDKVRSAIRNPWAHCNFTEWDTVKFNLSLQTIEDFIYLLKLNGAEESKIIGELNKWRLNGTSFFQGTTTGLEIVDNIQQEIQVLVTYADVICKSGDTEFSRVHAELSEMGTKLRLNKERILKLENTVALQGKTLLKADIPEIERWKQNSKDFIKTDIFNDILEILKDQHCVLLSGVSGMGKTLTAQNLALQLCYETGYSIVPCNDKLLSERVQLESIQKSHGEFTIVISSTDEQKYIDRLKMDLKNGKIHWCLNNVQMRYKEYREKFIDVIKDLDDDVKSRWIDIKDENGINAFIISWEDKAGPNEDSNEIDNRQDKLQKQDTTRNLIRNGWTPLYEACVQGDIGTFKSLIKNRANVNMQTNFGDMPLVAACEQGHGFLIQMLLEEKADVNQALYCAVQKDLQKSCPITISEEDTKKALISVFESGNKEMSKLLVSNGYTDNLLHNEAMLYHAYRLGLYENIEILGRYGMDVKKTYKYGYTPMILADIGGNDVLSEILQSAISSTPLHDVNVNLTFEEWKTKNDVSLSTTIRYGYTPLFAACQRQNYEIVDMLLERGANLNKALYDASREGFLNTVQFLLQKGADVISICRYGQTALYGACLGGHSNVVKFLIDQGSAFDTQVQKTNISDEITCLHAAYVCGNHDIVQLLINKGAFVDSVGNFGRTLLHKASRDGNSKIAKMLLEKGADINASDLYGSTPLIACVLQNIEDNHEKHYFDRHMRTYDLYEDFVKLHQDYLDQPYQHCVHFGSNYNLLTENHYKVIQLLIENGADIYKADKKGRAPLYYSKKIGDMKLTEMLLPKKFFAD